jgi:hypothetical protein
LGDKLGAFLLAFGYTWVPAGWICDGLVRDFSF